MRCGGCCGSVESADLLRSVKSVLLVTSSSMIGGKRNKFETFTEVYLQIYFSHANYLTEKNETI